MMTRNRRYGVARGEPFSEDRYVPVRLVHYTDKPLGQLEIRPQESDQFEPHGLWVSDDNCDDNWPSWCRSNDFGRQRLALAYDVTLEPDANILVVISVEDIDAFTREWAVHPIPGMRSNLFIDWTGVRERWDAMIITPYIYERRLSYGENDAMWYYTWNCASGCIWHPKAIASITLRENP